MQVCLLLQWQFWFRWARVSFQVILTDSRCWKPRIWTNLLKLQMREQRPKVLKNLQLAEEREHKFACQHAVGKTLIQMLLSCPWMAVRVSLYAVCKTFRCFSPAEVWVWDTTVLCLFFPLSPGTTVQPLLELWTSESRGLGSPSLTCAESQRLPQYWAHGGGY